MGYKFVKTDDGSVGLFDDTVNDIYHSSSGAYKEALDKFVIPSQPERFRNSNCRVLDICYGIGYNTKALLDYSNENNLNINFEIDALEMNEDLINISPFVKLPNPSIINFETDKFILNSILQNQKFNFNKIRTIINKNKNFLTLYKPDFDKIIQEYGYHYGVKDKINSNLHNIYYHYKSFRYKKYEKPYNLRKSSLKWHADDARKAVFSLSGKYDIIFLDAFSAAKQPTLWTKEFITKVCNLLNKKSGVLVSYSVASPFRKVLFDLGLNVGKFYLKNINLTLASYDINLVKYKLGEFEMNLLFTKAGIPYTDDTLSHTCDEILSVRNAALENSNLESTSKYYKRNGRKHGKY